MTEKVDATLRDNNSLVGSTVKWGRLLLMTVAVLSAVSCKPGDDDKQAADTFALIKNPYVLITDSELSESQRKIDEVWEKSESGGFTSLATTAHGIAIPAIEIQYRLIRNDKSTDAIVISSGRTESFIKYKETIYNLYKQGYSIYIHDHRGQGFSGRLVKDSQMGHVWDFDNYVRDLKQFYDQVVAQGKHGKIFLLAHSMGGGIATRYLEEHPSDFVAAALSSPMHAPKVPVGWCTGAKERAHLEGIGGKTGYILGEGAVLFDGGYKANPFKENDPKIMTHSKARYEGTQKLYAQYKEVRLGGVTSHWLAEACNASKKMVEDVSRIRTPILVIQAGEDVAVTAGGQNKFCAALLESNKVVKGCHSGSPIKIEGGYHELFVESDAYRIPAMTHVLDFFEEYRKL